MTTTYTEPTAGQMGAWFDATSDLRRSIFEDAYQAALVEIEADRKKRGVKQGMTHTQHEKARNIARGEVVRKLYRTKEHNGVRNPSWDDPEWGYGTREQRGESTTDHTPNKYAGKCVKCQGWIEAEKGKLVKTNGRFGVEHLGECPEAKPRPNRYAGSCVKCGQWVEAEQGTITQINGAWQTLHIGTCPEKPAEEAPKELGPDDIDLSNLVPGYYAVPGGDTRLKLAISTGRKGGRWEGHWFVKDAAEYGAGTKYGMQRPGSGYQGKVKDELRAILADPKGAMVAYGKLVGVCGACGRKLEDEASVAAGIGPICAQKW